jgi:hypothetical protein
VPEAGIAATFFARNTPVTALLPCVLPHAGIRANMARLAHSENTPPTSKKPRWMARPDSEIDFISIARLHARQGMNDHKSRVYRPFLRVCRLFIMKSISNMNKTKASRHLSTAYGIPCVKMHINGANMGCADIFW